MQGQELRLEVPVSGMVYLTLRSGAAEVFGSPLDLGERLSISGQKIAVFSWKGATLGVQGAPSVVYVSDDTPMSQYLNVHETLEARRHQAKANNSSSSSGPRTIVVGPTDAGKSSLCKILLNYAVRAGWAPTFADLDVGQGAITVPGCIAATPVEAPVDIEEGILTDAPIVYYSGNVSPSENPSLYKHLVERLAAVLQNRSEKDMSSRTAGIIINSMGWVEDLGYELLLHSIQTFKVDSVLVVGQEKLYSQLSAALKESPKAGHPPVSIVKLPKSAGVVTRSREERAESRKHRVEHYFYGPSRQLSPLSQNAKIADLKVFRVGGGPKAPASALPIGATSVTDPLKVTQVANLRDIQFTMVAVSHAPSADLLLSSNVAGFIYVQDVDTTAGTVSYLAPCPGNLPGQFLLAGSFKVYLD